MIYNRVRGIIQKYAPESVRTQAFNRDYMPGGKFYNTPHGRWHELYDLIAKYCCGESILNIGCGPGRTEEEMKRFSFYHCLGVDISPVSLEQAMERNKGGLDPEKITFFQCDALDIPKKIFGTFQLILFRETVYYIPIKKFRALLLELAAKNLAPYGSFMVTVIDKHYYSGYINVIREEFIIEEEWSSPYTPSRKGRRPGSPEQEMLIIVFCPRREDNTAV